MKYNILYKLKMTIIINWLVVIIKKMELILMRNKLYCSSKYVNIKIIY